MDMPVDVEALLRDVLSKVESENQRDKLEERFKALEDRKGVSMSDIIDALENASDDELNALRGTALGAAAADVQDDRDEEPPDDTDAPPAPRQRAARPRTRPGRKSGAAYDWWVDDETGEVFKLDVARVYTGDDEDDEVELREAEADNEDDAE